MRQLSDPGDLPQRQFYRGVYRVNVPIDQQARARALDPSASCIVQAPAGSGKTGLLIRRFLVLLARAEKPEEILAITFTRKAAAEIRKRVINVLQHKKEDGSAETSEELLALANAALENDRQHQWNLTTNSGRLRIQTIDSFNSELVNRMPWSARFGAPPATVEDARPVFREAALRVLSKIEQGAHPEVAQACGDLITLMNARLSGAIDLLANMLSRRDQWMRLPTQQSREQIEIWWQQTIDEVLTLADQLFDQHARSMVLELVPYAARHLGEKYPDTENPSALQQCADISAFPAPGFGCLRHWRGVVDLLLTGTGTLRKKVDVRQGFPKEGKDEKTLLAELIAMFEDDDSALRVLKRVAMLPNPTLSDAQWNNIHSILQIMPIAAAELRLLFNETGESDFIELGQRAEWALGDAEMPTDLALVFDYRLKHLMVDEFQDTSAGQVSLLEKLLAGWQSDDGRTLFLVGDPMQSIYRFREAEVANFLDVQDHGIADVLPECLRLETNFRSDAAVIDWCNQVFVDVMPQRNDRILGAVRYVPATAFHGGDEDAGVTVHAAIDRDQQTEAEEILTLVSAELSRDNSQSIAILGHNRRVLVLVANCLTAHGVSFDAVKLQTLSDRQAIQDLIAVTNVLRQPIDTGAWLGVLRAPWCGATLSELSEIFEVTPDRPPSKLLAAAEISASPRIQKVYETIEAAQRRFGREPLWQIVESVWVQLGGPAVVSATDLENCRRFIGLLAQMESAGTVINETTIAEAIGDLWASGNPEARVKLMTIHGSKGLEFDTVILPGLERGGRNNDSELIRIRQLPDRLLMAAKPSSQFREDGFYAFLGELEKESLRNESTRLLYVACTRARLRLHLFGSAGVNKSGLAPAPVNSLLGMLWPAVEYAFTDAYDLHDDASETDIPVAAGANAVSVLPDIQRLPADWQPPAMTNPIATAGSIEPAGDIAEEIDFDWASEVARVVGIVVHEIIQQIDRVRWQVWRAGNVNDSERDNWRGRLLENSLPASTVAAALQQVERAIANMREDAHANWIFDSGHSDIRAEWPVTGVLNNRVWHCVIDRFFIETDSKGNETAWIIDFKTSRHEEDDDLAQFLEQEKQRYSSVMSRYADIVGALTNLPVKTALYFPVLKRLEIMS